MFKDGLVDCFFVSQKQSEYISSVSYTLIQSGNCTRTVIKGQKKSPRRGIEPRSGTRQAPILTIKLSRKKQSTHDGGRTHNLLIRSQTRCHYATRATVCWKFSIINKYIPTLANITITKLRKLYKRFIDRESLFLIFFRKDEHIVQNIIN